MFIPIFGAPYPPSRGYMFIAILIKRCQERLGNESCSGVKEELHLGNLLVNLLLELNDKVDKLVLQHLFGVEVCYQEGNVIAGNGFSPQNEE